MKHARGSRLHQQKRNIYPWQGRTEPPCASSCRATGPLLAPLRQDTPIRRGTRRALPGVTPTDGSRRKRSRSQVVHRAAYPGALASRDIPPLIREAEQEPGAGRQSPSSGCSLTATAWITPLGDARVGHGKFTAASSPAGKGMQGKFTGVQPEPGPERQV